ncbi:unnamed protein product, partial [Discosporangium mesarthrocarpum]
TGDGRIRGSVLLKGLVGRLDKRADGPGKVPAVYRMLNIEGGRMTAEVLNEASGDDPPRGMGGGREGVVVVERSGERRTAKVFSGMSPPMSGLASAVPQLPPVAPPPLNILFNSSCDSAGLCVSPGAAFLVLDVCSLGKRTWGRGKGNAPGTRAVFPEAQGLDPAAGAVCRDDDMGVAEGEVKGSMGVEKREERQEIDSTASYVKKRTRSWKQGVSLVCTSLSIGGALRGSGTRLTGNVLSLALKRIDRSFTHALPVIVLLEAPAEDPNGVCLTWSLEKGVGAAGGEQEWGGGAQSVKLTGEFSSAKVNYVNAKAGKKILMSAWETWDAGAPSNTIEGHPGPKERGSSRNLAVAAGTDAPPAARMPNIAFDFTGSDACLQLPFDLTVEAEGVHIVSPPVSDSGRGGGARVRGPARAESRAGTGPHPFASASSPGFFPTTPHGSTFLSVTTTAARLLHVPQVCFGDGPPPRPMVGCVVRADILAGPGRDCFVSLRCNEMAVCLAPESCAAFGAFMRLMIGPPSSSRGRDDAARHGRARRECLAPSPSLLPPSLPPVTFKLELLVGHVDVDFVPGPCSPSAVVAAVAVRGTTLRHWSEVHAGGGPKQSLITMELCEVEGSQRRDPTRNAPALPQAAVSLI